MITAPTEGAVARTVRDLVLWDGADDRVYVAACDVNAAVGEQPGDFLQAPPESAGYNATKVALMEVLAAGAEPIVVLNTLCGPLDHYGSRVVAGVHRALADIDCRALVTGSDETNMRTTQTGVGVTIVGSAARADLRIGTSRPGDVVVCLGVPRDGVRRPYREGDPDVAAPRDVRAVRAWSPVHEVLPVGSKGVAHEVQQLATVSGLVVETQPDARFDQHASAGASTCFLVTVDEADLPHLCSLTDLPTHPVAHLRAPTTEEPAHP